MVTCLVRLDRNVLYPVRPEQIIVQTIRIVDIGFIVDRTGKNKYYNFKTSGNTECCKCVDIRLRLHVLQFAHKEHKKKPASVSK